MVPAFEFATATRIIFGPGRARELGTLAAALGRRALTVTGRDPARADSLLAGLETAGVQAHVYSVAGEPELTTVTEGVTKAKEAGCDLVISIGGGSAIDAGKAIAAMLTNDGQLLDYLEVIGKGETLSRVPAPFIAVPTTAGTGAEVTRNAVLASPQHRVKVSLRNAWMLPRIALVDPELTYGLPPTVTASTGLDALTQLIEPFVCARANPMTDALCLDGIPRVARSLPQCFSRGDDPAARQDMSLASLFGGLALANAGLGAVHGFAGPIGGMFSAPHGAVCAALLPHVMEVNVRALRQRQSDSKILARYDTVARLLTGNPSATSDNAVTWVRHLVQQLEIPSLRAYGIDSNSVEELVDNSAKASSMKANPIALTRAELRQILERAL
ncbi:MAG TPA: iron-containing alcohol dehydrogenase [Verrucomicrobiae bacterium]|nr:iron-containing alcohol dehydrogenase [Verrucomicrobiae bacterium]